ncbi:MAG: aspartate carbamoyltransferase [Burkholderiales bacterium]
MPFDMGKTVHIFAMTDTGGVQKVVVRDVRDGDQVTLIRQHLRHEAEAFQKGDFGDPGHLHGDAMPGLKDVRANASRIRVTYADLPNGAQISFETSDTHTITAIHRWFGAQLSEHGSDARAE